jgi:hypothetical protein
MCFSPTASFATGIFLIPAGIYCLNEVREAESEYIPIAAWPFFFGIQQVFEGLLWLGMESDQVVLIRFSSLVFLFFSHFFWLCWTPLSAFSLEFDQSKKSVLKFVVILGLSYGLLLYIPLLYKENFVDIDIIKNSIHYTTKFILDDLLPKNFSFWFYASIILGSLFISSSRSLNYLGWLLFASALVTYISFSYAFTSVWCFFSAILSVYLVYALKRAVRQKPPRNKNINNP